MRSRHVFAGAAVMIATCAPCVCAQDMHVSAMALEIDAWRFKPLYHTVNEAPRVDGFLALADTGATTGNNIVAVWYTRGAGGVWTAQSWLTTNTAEAVKSVKSMLSISGEEDPNWGLEAPLTVLPGQPTEPPQPYNKGVLTQDPFYPILATLPDPTPIVQLLTQAGYQAATIQIDLAGSCTASQQLESIAVAFEWGIGQTVVDEETNTAATQGTSQLLTAVVACWTPPCTCVQPSTWTVGAVVASGACNWVSMGTTSTPTTGGTLVMCNYEARKYFTQSRTAPIQWTNCSWHTCTQVRVGYASAAVSCGPITVPTGTTFPGCSPTYTGAGACPGACSATTAGAATTASTWGPFGPSPCACN